MDRINILEKQKQTKDEENNDKLSEESDDLIVGEKKNRVAKSKNKIVYSKLSQKDLILSIAFFKFFIEVA